MSPPPTVSPLSSPIPNNNYKNKVPLHVTVTKPWPTSLINIKAVYHRVTFYYLFIYFSSPAALPAPPSLTANFPWAVSTHSLLPDAPGALFFPSCIAVDCCCEKTPSNFLSRYRLGPSVGRVGEGQEGKGGCKTSTLEIDCAFYATALITPGAKWAVRAQRKGSSFFIYFHIYSLHLGWIDRAITERRRERAGVMWVKAPPGETLQTRNGVRDAYRGKLLHVNHHYCIEMKPGYEEASRPGGGVLV